MNTKQLPYGGTEICRSVTGSESIDRITGLIKTTRAKVEGVNRKKERTFIQFAPAPMKMFLVAAAALAGSAALADTVYVGNSLNVPNGNSDSIAPLVILGDYNPSGPSASSAITLPTGTVQDVQFYGGNYDFTLYALAVVGYNSTLNQQTLQVVASENFSGSASPGIQTLAVSGFSVRSGDLLAFAGIGPYYPQNPNDALNSDATFMDTGGANLFAATPPGGAGTQFTVGPDADLGSTYDYVSDYFGNQGRTYGIGVDVSTPDSGSTLLLAVPTMFLLAGIKRYCLSGS